jgi:hypothetical protein
MKVLLKTGLESSLEFSKTKMSKEEVHIFK